MEIKQYIIIFQKYLKFLILFFILGLIAGYVFSIFQTPVFQATTKVLIMESLESRSLDLLNQSESQMAQTFIELLTTRPIIQAAAETLGTDINPNHIRVQQVRDAELIEVIVEDSDPQQAANIANTLVKVFVDNYEEIQNARFKASEDSLSAQIQQVEQQMNDLQNQSQASIQENLTKQLAEVSNIINDLQTEIKILEEEIISLVYAKEVSIGTNLSGQRIYITPTPSINERIEIAEKENRLNELKSLLESYQAIYVNLSFPGQDYANFMTLDMEQNQAAIDLYQQIYETLLSNYEAVRLSRVRDVSNIIQVEAALPPENPISPRTLINIIFGGILAVLLTGAFVFVIEYLDDSLKSPEEISNLFNAPVLGYIGEIPSNEQDNQDNAIPYIVNKPHSIFAESFRILRTNLVFCSLDTPLKTILITSPSRGEGKTTVACNLAISIAQSGKQVTLIDADLRRPRIHQELKLNNRTGLSDLLREEAIFYNAVQYIKQDNLTILTSGSLPPNPTDVLNSEKMLSILEEISAKSDLVIIDSPPTILADTSVLATRVDGNLVVVHPNHTSANAAIQMVDQFDRINAKLIGVVINRYTRALSPYYQNIEEYTSST